MSPLPKTEIQSMTASRARQFLSGNKAACLAVGFSALLAIVLVGQPVLAQSSVLRGQLRDLPEQAEEAYGFREGSFIVAPIPFQNPTLGTGLTLGAGYLFKADEGSNTSTLGFGGLKTSNGSKAYALGANVSLSNNKWRFLALAGKADINYDLFLGDAEIPVQQDGEFYRLGVFYGVAPNLSFGVAGQALNTTLKLDGAGGLPDGLIPNPGLSTYQLDLVADWDRRNDNIYPTSGSHLVVTLSQAEARYEGGRDDRFGKAKALYDIYFPVGQADVIAGRLAACGAGMDAPFFEKCALGAVDNFRGFPATEYIGTRLVSAQAEYRGRINKWLGYVAFAGVGAVSGLYDNTLNSSLRVAGGVGTRIRLSQKQKLDYAIDVAFNNQSDTILYISIGQRF